MSNPRQSVLDDDRIGSLLFKLTAPAFFGMSVTTLYNIVDTIFVGRLVGPLGIAGLSIVFPLQMLSMGIGQLAGMGGASLISRLIGDHDLPRAEQAVGNALTGSFLLSLALMAMVLAAPDFWLRLMGASDAIIPFARDYLILTTAGVVFPTLAMAINALLRAEGSARISMNGMILGAVLNTILDAVFMIPLGMGIRGAALATVIAQMVSVAYYLRFYFTGRSFLKIRPGSLIIRWEILKPILAIGVASFARTLAVSFSAVFVNRSLIVFGSDLSVSAFGIINRIAMFALMPGIVIGQGLQPILGFNYGARRYDRGLRVINIAMVAATIAGIIAFIALVIYPEPFIRIFTNSEDLIVQSVHAAKTVFLCACLIGFLMVGSTVFQSIGKAGKSFLTSIARPALFLLPLVFILPEFMGLDGVWMAFPLADILTSILTAALLVPELRDLSRRRALAKSKP